MKFTTDAKKWHRKWSTWLALAAASSAGGLGAYAVAPTRAQDMVPDWALGALITIAIVTAILVPVATSLSQAKLEDAP
ncbi:hypothetical protein LVB77_14650 [Lysobacter sp. 5GHs7-4]|uniref:DUF7940 domain-containing protein n=1 Tax=Lysobacter sp. 5GHs7-4 TaxID=2904253 RepID=UPI001E47822D|nr:hypothetical protein [Lysobacter sp. 5GHs7-4]UHQ21906.1 hypothetical protein LVB77_14650 [Lysobacter sp. 5GHs7-4]